MKSKGNPWTYLTSLRELIMRVEVITSGELSIQRLELTDATTRCITLTATHSAMREQNCRLTAEEAERLMRSISKGGEELVCCAWDQLNKLSSSFSTGVIHIKGV